MVFVEHFPQEGMVGFVKIFVFNHLPDRFVIVHRSVVSVYHMLGNVKHLGCASSPFG
jgi:hypothetical protein